MLRSPTAIQPSPLKALHHWFSTHPQWVNALLLVALVVVIHELLWQFDVYYDVITKNTLGLTLLVVIVVAAFRNGLWPAVIVALISNAYLFFAFTSPGRNLESFGNLASGEWLIIILFLGPAIIVGYLKEQVNKLLLSERQSRSMAESERNRLTTILEQLPVGVVIADAANGKVMFGNQYLEQLLGHPSIGSSVTEASVDGSSVGDISRVKTDATTTLPLQEWPLRQVLEGQSLQNEEYSYTHDGHTHIFRVSGTPIYNANQKVTAGVVIIDDITKEKELEQRKDDFASMVSHELKTPLTSLKMYIQLVNRLLEPSADPAVSKALEKANNQTDKLTQLINDMLALSRIQSDKLEYRFESLDSYALVNEIVEDLQAAFPDQILHLAGQAGQYISADQYRLGQVVINLITNAIKYAPDSNDVFITVEQRDDEVIMSVKDFGIGIAPGEQERIFERFYQAPNKNSTYPGLGIGLYLSAEIVKHHGGRLWVDSVIGQGSTFYMAIPAHQPIPDFSSSARTITGKSYATKK